MKYSPVPKNKKAFVISLILIITAVALFVFATTGLTKQVALIQFMGVGCLAVATFFMIKGTTVFTYMVIPLDSEDKRDYSEITEPLAPDQLTFTVSKRFGKGRDSYQCQMDLSSLKTVAKLPADGEEKRKIITSHGQMPLYKYVTTVGPVETVLLIFNKPGYDKTAVIIEPDNSMYQYLRTVAEINRRRIEED